MIEVLPFKPEHMLEIKDPDLTGGMVPTKESSEMLSDACGKNAFTIKIDGKTLLCGGVAALWDGRGEAWAILDKNSKPHFAAIHKVSKRFFDSCPVRRIEASIPVNFENARRWIELLGFDLEADCRKAYLPDGSNWALYARVK